MIFNAGTLEAPRVLPDLFLEQYFQVAMCTLLIYDMCQFQDLFITPIFIQVLETMGIQEK